MLKTMARRILMSLVAVLIVLGTTTISTSASTSTHQPSYTSIGAVSLARSSQICKPDASDIVIKDSADAVTITNNSASCTYDVNMSIDAKAGQYILPPRTSRTINHVPRATPYPPPPGCRWVLALMREQITTDFTKVPPVVIIERWYQYVLRCPTPTPARTPIYVATATPAAEP